MTAPPAAPGPSSIPLSPHLENTQSSTFQTGLAIRSSVMSPSFATRALSSTTPFNAPLQEAVTSFAWGQVWSRPGLGRRDRSLLNLAILIALSKPTELAGHTRGALTNGITKEELAEVALHAAVYCGFPAALDAARTMERVVNEVEAEQLAERERQKEQEHEHEKEHGHEGKKEDKEP